MIIFTVSQDFLNSFYPCNNHLTYIFVQRLKNVNP